MALNPNDAMPSKTTAPSTDYPYGGAQNITTPSDGTGTPWLASVINDIWGFQQALLTQASIVPTGNAETAVASQYLDAVNAIVAAAVSAGGFGDMQSDGSVSMTGNLNIGAGVDELKILFDQPYTEKAMLWGYDRGLLIFPTDATANPVGVPWINCTSNSGATTRKVELYTQAGVSLTTIPEGVRMHDRAYVNRPDTVAFDELTSKQYVDTAINNGVAGAGDFFANGSVPMTGTLTINDSGDIIDAGNLIIVSGGGGVGFYSGSPGNYYSGLELGIGSSGYARIREGSGTEAVVYCNANKVQLLQDGATVCAETATPALGGLLVNNLATGAGIERALTVSDLLGEVFIGSQAQNALIHVDPNTESVLINSSQDWQAGWEAFKVVPDALVYDGDPIGGVRATCLRLILSETTTPFPDEDVSDFNIGEHTARNTKMAVGGLCAAFNGEYSAYGIDTSEITLRSILDSDPAVGGRFKLTREGTTWNELEGPAGVYTRVYESTLATLGGLLVNNQVTGATLERVLTVSDLTTFVRKTVSENRASTITPAVDADLIVPLVANTRYKFTAFLKFEVGVGGARIEWALPAGASIDYEATFGTGTSAEQQLRVVGYGATTGPVVMPFAFALNPCVLTGYISTTGTAGNCQLLWAQETSDAANSSLLINSTLELTRVG